MDSMLPLACGDTSMLLCPGVGGAVARLDWRGHHLLRPAPEHAGVRQMALYSLVPYSNRIGNGELAVAGRSYLLRPNFPPEPHSVHGFGWQRAWQLDDAGAHWARMVLHHVPDQDWPFACMAALHLQLRDDGLDVRLSLTNTGTRRMPAGLGFHPYFPCDATTGLQCGWSGRWNLGQDHLPTTHGAAPADADFSTLRAVGNWRADHCFTGWNGTALLAYESHQVRVDAGPECPFIVCFRPADGRAFIALEPVSHASNAHQLALHKVPNTGIIDLAPGATFTIHMAISAIATARQT